MPLTERPAASLRGPVAAVARALDAGEPRVWMWRDGLTVIGLDSRLPNREPGYLTFDDRSFGGSRRGHGGRCPGGADRRGHHGLDAGADPGRRHPPGWRWCNMTTMTRENVLFSGKLGTQSVHVWLEWRAGDLLLCSQDIGPALEPLYGEDEIETFLTVRAAQLSRLARAIGCPPDSDAIEAALLDRFRGDSAATTHLRALLAEHDIPYEFFLT